MGLLDAPSAPQRAITPLTVFMGDSITEGSTDQANNIHSDCFPTYFALESSGRTRIVRNSGAGGETTTAMLARFNADVLAYNPTTVIIATGTNDTSPIGQTLVNLEAMIRRCRNRGVQVILGTIPPVGVGPLAVPEAPTLTASATGGTMPAGEYGYVVAVSSPSGRGLPSEETTVEVTGSTSSVTVDWDAIPGSYSATIYRRNPGGSLGVIDFVGPGSSIPVMQPQYIDTYAQDTPGTAPPVADASAAPAPTSTERANRLGVNRVKRHLAEKYGLLLVDQYEILTSPTTGYFRQGYSVDKVHPTSAVSNLMGVNLWTKVGSYFPQFAPYLVVDKLDPTGMIPAANPSAGGGPINGALLPFNITISDTAPMHWSVYGGTGVGSLAADADGHGNVFTVTSDTYTAMNTYRQITTGFSPGDVISVAFRFKAVGLDVNGGRVVAGLRANDGTGSPTWVSGVNVASDVPQTRTWEGRGVVRPGCTILEFDFNVSGRATAASISQVTIRNLTVEGLA
jgi:hypothetical protein